MKKKFSTLILLSIVFIISAYSGSAPQITDAESQAIIEQNTDTPPEANQDFVDICDLSEEQSGEDVRVNGTIVFLEENPEGTFAELESSGCRVGSFVPKEKFDQWDTSSQEALQMNKVVEVWGTLVSHEGQLIIDLAGIAPSTQTNAAEEEVESSDKVFSLPPAPENAALEVPLIYSGVDGLPGLCYLGAAGMLVKFEHPDLVFSDIVALSGMGSSALHLDYKEMPSMLTNAYADQGIVFMLNNLNAGFILGNKIGGNNSDPFHPAKLPFDENAAHQLTFESEEDALATLKSIVGSGRPVMVYLDLFYVHDDFAATSEFWRDFLGKDHASHYMVVTGFDADNLYLNDPTDPTPAAGDLSTSIENFMLAWENTTDIPNAPLLGPYWMVYIENPGIVPDVVVVIEKNLEKAINAPTEIRSFAEKPNNSEFTCFLLLELGNTRLNFGEYLLQNGFQEAGDLYIQSGTLLIEMASEENVQSDIFKNIADLEEAAIMLLNE